MAQVVEELNKGAEHHGFPGHIWTRPRVNQIIIRSYDPSQVLLKKVGWSRQKPQAKARQQDPERVHWRHERLPDLKKSPNWRVILYEISLLLAAHVGLNVGIYWNRQAEII